MLSSCDWSVSLSVRPYNTIQYNLIKEVVCAPLSRGGLRRIPHMLAKQCSLSQVGVLLIQLCVINRHRQHSVLDAGCSYTCRDEAWSVCVCLSVCLSVCRSRGRVSPTKCPPNRSSYRSGTDSRGPSEPCIMLHSHARWDDMG